MIRLTEEAHQTFLAYMRHTPEDKRTWSVLGVGRTPLALMQEIAMAPTWAIEMLAARACMEYDEQRMAADAALMGSWDTFDKCEAVLRENLDRFYELVRTFPQDELGLEIRLTFANDLPQSMADLMSFPYWNTTYHLGQLAFIQTLYGDKAMY
ncbi:MAG: hypothetical protein ACK4XJ_11240 [Fimbriimonadaceae bacterium]